MRYPIPFAVLCVALSGCGSLTTHNVLTGAPAPPHGGGARVFLQGQPVPPGLREVAIVQAVGTGTKADLESVTSGLVLEAQRLGCTAIANVKIDQGSGTASGTGVCMVEANAPVAPLPAPP
jgi:hypothetical protein